jgi:xanthine/uracil permease
VFFVNVASKGFSQSVSLLFATLAGWFISVAAKEVKAMVDYCCESEMKGERAGDTRHFS